MPIVFFARHFGHGAGSLFGLLKAIIIKITNKSYGRRRI
jgi:hypothetical protein